MVIDDSRVLCYEATNQLCQFITDQDYLYARLALVNFVKG